MYVSRNFDADIAYLEEKFKNCGDIVTKTFVTHGEKAYRFYIAYFDDLVNRELIESHVIRGLMVDVHLNGRTEKGAKELIESALMTADYTEERSLDAGISGILAGNTLLLAEGFDRVIVISSKSVPTRGVNKPETEVTVQGPQDSFSESIRTNTVLIRRRVRDASLKCIQLKTGRKTQTDTALMYIEGAADSKIVDEALRRLKSIDADSVLDSGYIEQYIRESGFSPFPQAQLTERPDKAAAELLEGRIAIIVDNSPFVILIPAVLACFYQAADDYYQRPEIASFVRLIRFAAGFFAFALPALYVAVTLYAPSMLPLDLMLHLAQARMGVPVSTLTEVIGMELAFEALREAGIRLPAPVGGTLGIVGGIIIGQAAVDAGLVSPMVIIVSAFTGICSFVMPTQSLASAYRLIKYFMIILSAFFGIYGFMLGLLCVIVHIASLESFGISYLYPLVGEKNIIKRFRDSILRLPLSVQQQRPPVFGDDKK
ncbi:MAG: spore germination protein [Firmicutes bacterium]|nr:spore germination protein [Bacillota bacterium]